MKKWWTGFLLNVQFFTAVPIRKMLPMEPVYLNKSIKTFPILGLLQGMIYAGFLYFLVQITPFSSLTAAVSLWLLTIVGTGGLHLDGWIDTSDAFFSYRDREKRLEILKDPRVGAFGVLSVILLLAVKFFFIYEIVERLQQLETYLLLFFIPFLSKLVMGLLLIRVKEAKQDGLGAYFKKAATRDIPFFYMGYILVVLIFLSWWNREGLVVFSCFLLFSFCFYFYLSSKMKKEFGGLTGDLLGASVEGTELFLWGILWLSHYFVMG